jgi:uncharacterized protein YndB with AHSA1/START domain
MTDMDDLGTVDTTYTVTFTRQTRHSPGRVWRAITEPAEIEAWMDFPVASADIRQGGHLCIDFSRTASGRPSPDAHEGNGLDAIVVYTEPDRALALAWGPTPLPTGTGAERAIAGLRHSGWEVMEWTIEPNEDGSTYTFAHHGLSAQTMERESIAWGWHSFLDQLDAHLDGAFSAGRFAGMTDEAQRTLYEHELKAAYQRHLDTLLRR